jgi:protein-S-isoprenylcysteine O-methyltransferase Ste14
MNTELTSPNKKNKTFISFITDGLSYSFFMIVLFTFVWLIYQSEARATIEFQLAPNYVIILSLFIILIVGFLEGSQLAIINISDRKRFYVSDKFETAGLVLQMTHTKESIHNYLIGRQLMVVVLVIIFSLLTAFPNINSNTFNFEIPKIINIIAFKLGLVNALILLWLGQLFPQLFANKSPQHLLNYKLVKYLVKLCFIISASKVAKPSSLLVDLATINEHNKEKPRKYLPDEK